MSLMGAWKHIVKISSEFTDMGVDLSTALKMEERGGNNTLFLLERWGGEETFYARFPSLFQLEVNKWCKVPDRLLMYSGELCGKWGWARSPYGSVEINELRELLAACQQVCLYEGEDKLVWDLDDSGTFSVRSLKQKFAMNLNVGENYIIKWNNFVPKKVGILDWNVEMERIPVLLALARRGVVVGSMVCPICDEDIELAEHLYVSCQFA
ncbi:uncharacterized protein LOC143576135 [Bidens hawaiensis]|uniref:uncharacterized protein LOC143576135 n=1 Tax=Bidens hawaiensis TaxID=980011 RepID=UPI00404A71B8